MNYYDSMPSLRHIACIKISIALWGNVRIDLELNNDFYFFRIQGLDLWKGIEDKVIQRVQNLPLPKPLKQEVSNIVKPIGVQIYNWIYSNITHCNHIRCPTCMCWTPQGTIDKIKTAKALVEDVRLSGPERYRLACTYCLEDYISVLWEQLKLVQDESFLYDVLIDNYLLSFWSSQEVGIGQLRNKWQISNGLYRQLLFSSAVYRNEAAFKFFFRKLPHEYRKKNVVKLAQDVEFLRQTSECNDLSDDFYGTALCILCSSMSEEQQIEFFKICPYGMLACLLHWPRQNFFIETAERMWSFLSPKNYKCLLRDIVYGKIVAGYKDYDYQNLFSEFWKQSPTGHKKYVIHECLYYHELLFDLFKSGDTVNLKLIFEAANATERRKLIFSHKNIYKFLVHNEEFSLLEFFIRSCISSRSVLFQFKEETEPNMWPYFTANELNMVEDMWDRLLPDDDAIQQFDNEEHPEDGPAIKKLCT